MLTVLAYPCPVLLRKAGPVTEINRSLRRLVDEMFETMYAERGVGLAAPQIGQAMRLCVVNASGKESGELALINPVIVESSGEATDEEGCLSVPGIRTKVTRPEYVHVRAYDLTGQELDIEADGLEGRCLQHEIDHLQGRLFFQRLTEAARMTLRHQIKRLEQRYEQGEGEERG
jgi:peptide deformylase